LAFLRGVMARAIRTIALTAAAILAIAAAGCGSESDEAAEGGAATAEEAALGFVHARQAGDVAEACTFFADEELTTRMGSAEQCAQSMETGFADPHALDGFEITHTHPGPEGATVVEFKLANGTHNQFTFKQEEGAWKFFEG
jgi:hypothetical protein